MVDALKYYIEETTCNDKKALKFVEEQLKEFRISEEIQYVLLEIAKQFAIVFSDSARFFFENFDRNIHTILIANDDETLGELLFNQLYISKIPFDVLQDIKCFMDFESFAHSTCADDFTYYNLENGKVAFVQSDEL
jgi:hypothetical protein